MDGEGQGRVLSGSPARGMHPTGTAFLSCQEQVRGRELQSEPRFLSPGESGLGARLLTRQGPRPHMWKLLQVSTTGTGLSDLWLPASSALAAGREGGSVWLGH